MSRNPAPTQRRLDSQRREQYYADSQRVVSAGDRITKDGQVNIEGIISAIRNNRIRISDHADEETQADQLSFDEVFHSVFQGEIIEDYPDDWPYPSCLVYVNTFRGEPVHSVGAYNESSNWAALITVYRPDPARWIDWRTRRSEHDPLPELPRMRG